MHAYTCIQKTIWSIDSELEQQKTYGSVCLIDVLFQKSKLNISNAVEGFGFFD